MKKFYEDYKQVAVWYVCWIVFASLILLIFGNIGGFIVIAVSMFALVLGFLGWIIFMAATGIGLGLVSEFVPGFELILYSLPG